MHDGSFPFGMAGGVPVVTAPEEIDITSAPGLRSALLEASAHGHGTLVVDMTGTQFCDSSGLHTLLAAHKRARAEGGEMLLVIPANAALDARRGSQAVRRAAGRVRSEARGLAGQAFSSSSNAFASLRSAVSKPSVNQL